MNLFSHLTNTEDLLCTLHSTDKVVKQTSPLTPVASPLVKVTVGSLHFLTMLPVINLLILKAFLVLLHATEAQRLSKLSKVTLVS